MDSVNLPDLVRAAAQSWLGLIALIIVAVAGIAYWYFGKAPMRIRLAVFCLLFLGASVFVGAVIGEHRKDRGSSGTLACEEYQKGHEDFVACNASTIPGYYWKLGKRLDTYSTLGADPVGGEPRCDGSSLGATAMTVRFPLAEGRFRAVREGYVNKSSVKTASGCNYEGKDGQNLKRTDEDLSRLCGIFQVACHAQP